MRCFNRLDIALSIGVWLGSIRSTIHFLFDFYEKLFFWLYVKCSQLAKIFITKYFSRTVTSCNAPLSLVSCSIVKSFKNSHLTWNRLLWWELVNLAHQNPPLTLSDQAEIFTTDTLEVGPEVKSAVFNLDPSIGIYRVLKNKTLSWPNTFTYFFY